MRMAAVLCRNIGPPYGLMFPRVPMDSLQTSSSIVSDNSDAADDDEHPEVAIEKASHELFRQSSSVVETDASDHEEFQVKEHHRDKPHANIASEGWSAKEQDGTSVFSDESDKATSEG